MNFCLEHLLLIADVLINIKRCNMALICTSRVYLKYFLLQDGEAYAYLLNALAPEVAGPSSLAISDPTERASMVLEQAEKLDCKRYLTPKDIVEGSPNLNLAFVAQIFQHRYG